MKVDFWKYCRRLSALISHVLKKLISEKYNNFTTEKTKCYSATFQHQQQNGKWTSRITHQDKPNEEVVAIILVPCKRIFSATKAVVHLEKPCRADPNFWLDATYEVPESGEQTADHEFGGFSEPGWSLKVVVKPKLGSKDPECVTPLLR